MHFSWSLLFFLLEDKNMKEKKSNRRRTILYSEKKNLSLQYYGSSTCTGKNKHLLKGDLLSFWMRYSDKAFVSQRPYNSVTEGIKDSGCYVHHLHIGEEKDDYTLLKKRAY